MTATPTGTGVTAARIAREELGLGLHGPIPDILALLEGTAGILVAVLDLPDAVSGACVTERDTPFIFVNGTHQVVRQRFTLAHEYGHLRLGHMTVVEGDADFTSKPKETAADAFAAEFLAPEPAVNGWLDAHGRPKANLTVAVRLADAFGISAEAAVYRLDAVRLLTPALKRRLVGEIAAGHHTMEHHRLSLPGLHDSLAAFRDRLPYLPSRLRERALAAYGAGAVSAERIADSLHLDVQTVERMLADAGIERPAEPEVVRDERALSLADELLGDLD